MKTQPRKVGGRPRKDGAYNLPPGVYFGKNRWYYRNSQGKEKRLAGPEASQKQVWDAYVKVRNLNPDEPMSEKGTLEWLCDLYIASERYQELAPCTQRDYKTCKKSVCEYKLKSGQKFGTVRASSITPGVIRKYADKRAESSPTRSNRELAFLAGAFRWGYEYDHVPSNPALGIKKKTLPPRTRCPTEEEYQAAYKRAPEWLQICMELAYLCRLRRGEIIGPDKRDQHGKVVGLQLQHILEEGLHVVREKGSVDQVITWTPRLREAVNRARKLPSTIGTMRLIHDRRGQKIQGDTFSSAWTRLMKKVVAEEGIEPFTFHDLKRMGVTHAEGDKLQASGHKSASMLKVYDQSVPVVAPTK